MPFEIRAMIAADIAAAHRLWADAEGVEIAEGDSAPEIARFLERNPGVSTVAEDNGELVGAVMCGHDGRRGYVYHLAVAGHRRREGIGRALMDRSLAQLRAAGIVRALLLVAADNAGGEKFWGREGWERLEFAKPMALDL